MNMSPGRPEYTCSAVEVTSQSNIENDMNKFGRVHINDSNYTCLLYGELFSVTMEYMARTSFITIT